MVDAVSAGLPPAYPAPSAGAPDLAPAPQTASEPALPGQAGPDGRRSTELSDQTLDQIAARLVALDSRLAISHDSVIERFIYKFVNPNNGKVLQQYPQKMTLNTMYAMEEAYQRFLDEHA
jgi:uncharacterized FlaG/YvyC family protein